MKEILKRVKSLNKKVFEPALETHPEVRPQRHFRSCADTWGRSPTSWGGGRGRAAPGSRRQDWRGGEDRRLACPWRGPVAEPSSTASGGCLRQQDGLPRGPALGPARESHAPDSPQMHENGGWAGLAQGRRTFHGGSPGPGCTAVVTCPFHPTPPFSPPLLLGPGLGPFDGLLVLCSRPSPGWEALRGTHSWP